MNGVELEGYYTLTVTRSQVHGVQGFVLRVEGSRGF